MSSSVETYTLGSMHTRGAVVREDARLNARKSASMAGHRQCLQQTVHRRGRQHNASSSSNGTAIRRRVASIYVSDTKTQMFDFVDLILSVYISGEIVYHHRPAPSAAAAHRCRRCSYLSIARVAGWAYLAHTSPRKVGGGRGYTSCASDRGVLARACEARGER